ncbi:MAG: large subunit ribosomal protein [Patescibacteria group bacterium]|jgi:large subunit ribosomal protein L25|nr:large subunit ribosomal protein [Patescibacteria group bacterium]
MDKIVITARTRDAFGKKLASSRKSGDLPAIVYGQEKDNEPIFLNAHEFSRVFSQAGQNTIIELKIDQDKSSNVLIQDIARHPVTNDITHADLLRLNMSQSIRAQIPLSFVGESSAVYQLEGTLLTNIEEVEVETLPAKLPSNIEVDISELDDFEKTIHIKDLDIPEGVELLVDPDELVCKVEPPRSQEEIDALDEEIVEEIPAEEGEEVAEGEEVTEGGDEQGSSGQDSDKESSKKE